MRIFIVVMALATTILSLVAASRAIQHAPAGLESQKIKWPETCLDTVKPMQMPINAVRLYKLYDCDGDGHYDNVEIIGPANEDRTLLVFVESAEMADALNRQSHLESENEKMFFARTGAQAKALEGMARSFLAIHPSP